ncbi:MAG: exosortase U [Gemmatales bacterium]
MSIEMPAAPAELVAEVTPLPSPPVKQVKVAEKRISTWTQWIPLLIVVAAFIPMLVMHGVTLWAKPHYQFFPLVIAGSAVLGYFGCQRLGRLHPGRYQTVAMFFGFLSLLGLGAGAFLQSSLIAFGSFLVGSLAFIYSWGGKQLIWKWMPAWLFLWLMMPPPFNWDNDFIVWLKFITARWTGHVLDVFGIVHVMEGNVVIVPPYSQLAVEEACSGIHSFFAIITCAMFFVFWFGRPVLHAILLILGSIGWVLAANCARVVLIAVAQVRFNIDLAHGLRHDILGFVIFLFLVLLTLSLDRLLCFVFESTYSFMALFRKGRMVLSKMMESQKKKIDLGTTRWPGLSATWVYAKPIMAVALLLCVTNYALAFLGVIEVAAPSDGNLIASLNKMEEGIMPPRIDTRAGTSALSWVRFGFKVEEERPRDDKNGRFTRYWQYKAENMDLPVTFSCDYPFMSGHDLTICYAAAGWTKVDDKLMSVDLPNGDKEMYVYATFRKPDGQFGVLFFSLLDEQGRPQQPRYSSTEGSLQNRIRRLKEMVSRKASDLRYQTQLFAAAYNPINSNDQEHLLQLYMNCRNRLTQNYLAASQGGK